MLIKLYTRGVVNHVHIIENVTQVRYVRALQWPDKSRIPTITDQSFEHLDMADEKYVLVEFMDKESGENMGVRVYNHAYICNDDGRTIEKVSASDFYAGSSSNNASSSKEEVDN